MASYNWPSQRGGGGLASNVVAISSGASSKAITYTTTLSSVGVPVFSIVNTTDSSPIFIQGIITAYSTTGFTVLFNTSTDTANYLLAYTVSEVA